MASQAHITPQVAARHGQGKARAAVPGASTIPGDLAVPAHRLYRATLDLLRRSADPAGERHVLLLPLSAALAIQTTRKGVQYCAALNAALARGDYEAALDACVALVVLAAEPEPPGVG